MLVRILALASVALAGVSVLIDPASSFCKGVLGFTIALAMGTFWNTRDLP